MQNLSKIISESEFYTILSYGWWEAANVVILTILLTGSNVPIFYRAIDISNLGRTGECICAAILGVVNTLDTPKLAAIVMDGSFDMKYAHELIEGELPNVVVVRCISTELELLIREIFQIPKIVVILNNVRFVALMISGWSASENQWPRAIPKASNLKEIYNFLVRLYHSKSAILKVIYENELRTGVGNMGRIWELIDSELFWDVLLDVILVLKAPMTLLENVCRRNGFGEVSDGFRELYAGLKTVETKSLDVSVIEKMVNARRKQPEQLDSARRYLKKLFNEEADEAKAWDEFSRFQNEKSKKMLRSA
ncbi:hypothetical protein HK098_006665, partial [Nowakowskiella sp. JEL0407]